MEKRIVFIPLAQKIIKTAAESAGISEDHSAAIEKVKGQIDDVIISPSEELTEEIDRLIDLLRPEPTWAAGARAVIRPVMTLVLTVTFITLILGQVGFLGELPTADQQKVYKEVFTVFLAIYGPIIGFWFGERTAEKSTKK